jgi:hypothetical protein
MSGYGCAAGILCVFMDVKNREQGLEPGYRRWGFLVCRGAKTGIRAPVNLTPHTAAVVYFQYQRIVSWMRSIYQSHVVSIDFALHRIIG